MDFGPLTYALGLLAGVLSTLSPCVLPIVPILIGTAVAQHRHAPWALAGGLAVSYAVLGTTLAWAGASIGLDTGLVRVAGAIVLGLFGILLMSGGLQARFGQLTAGIGDAGQQWIGLRRIEGLKGQFLVGLLLGVVWSPCVGPTLGAAVTLASQGSRLPQVVALMALFGLGAALPLVLLSLLSRAAITRVRGRLLQAGKGGKIVLGGLMLALSVLILTGQDKAFETWMVDHSPPWLTRLTTRF